MRLQKYILLLCLTLVWGNIFSANRFVSPKGKNQNSGRTKDLPLADISGALNGAIPGDTIFLLPGIYNQQTIINELHGYPDRCIVIMSLEDDPVLFGVIDLQKKFNEEGGEAFILTNSSWLKFINIIFKNAWPTVLDIFDSKYITISNCYLQSGKRVICPQGHGSHHVLVENCTIEHPEEVWNKWSWVDIHHGMHGSYNGGLLHPKESGGGHVMRDNTIVNLYNGIRTRPKNITQDGNLEIYGNTMINIRDNDFEPEGWAWNIHYHHNRHVNIHKVYSIDNVQGGNIFIYGNTYTQSKDDWALKEVGGIFKYSMGPLTYPCYAFNNSYYTAAKILRRGESTNHQLKHFNNAYYFFEGEQHFQLIEWQPGYEFDHDCINQDWPENIYNHKQEINGLKHTNPQFVKPESNDFRLESSSPCIDKGKALAFPEFDWVQSFNGIAPDIGAYEGEQVTDGPPFRFIPSPEGAHYKERPRISRHQVVGTELILHFSAGLSDTNVFENNLQLYQNGMEVPTKSFTLSDQGFTLKIKSSVKLNHQHLSLSFRDKPLSVDGLSLTYWASTIDVGNKVVSHPDLSVIVGNTKSQLIDELLNNIQIVITPVAFHSYVNIDVHHNGIMSKSNYELEILDKRGALVKYVTLKKENKTKYYGFLNSSDLKQGVYFAKLSVNTKTSNNLFVLHNEDYADL